MAEVKLPCWAACHCGCAWIPSYLSCLLSFCSLSMPHPSHTHGVRPGWARAFKYRWQFLQLYPGCRRTGCSHLNLNLLTKELTHHFFSFTSQISAVSLALFQFCALCYLDAVFLSWCWKPDKCLWCKGLAASLLLLPISVKPLWAVVAKLLECIMVCGWSPGPCFLPAAPSHTWSCVLLVLLPGSSNGCQGLDIFASFPPPKGQILGSVCHAQNSSFMNILCLLPKVNASPKE